MAFENLLGRVEGQDKAIVLMSLVVTNTSMEVNGNERADLKICSTEKQGC